MPDLLDMPDFVSVKVYHVNIIGFESVACRWAGAPLTCMRSHKDRIRGNILLFFVGSKRLLERRGVYFGDVAAYSAVYPLLVFAIVFVAALAAWRHGQ